MSDSKEPLTAGQRAFSHKIAAIALAACGAISATGYYFGIAPAMAGLVERRAKEQELSERRQRVTDLTSELGETRRKLAITRTNLADLPLRLEPSSAVNRRINWLASVAGEANVTLNEIQPQPAIEGIHYQTVPIRVAGSGGFPACAAFLHKLRTRFPDTTVKSFEIQNGNPGRSGNVASFRIELSWHTTPGAK